MTDQNLVTAKFHYSRGQIQRVKMHWLKMSSSLPLINRGAITILQKKRAGMKFVLKICEKGRENLQIFYH